MKKVLPLLMAAVMVTAGMPMAVSASETGDTVQDAGSTETGTSGTDSTGAASGTSGETGAQTGTGSGDSGTAAKRREPSV